jgi:hypothetical protein
MLVLLCGCPDCSRIPHGVRLLLSIVGWWVCRIKYQGHFAFFIFFFTSGDLSSPLEETVTFTEDIHRSD